MAKAHIVSLTGELAELEIDVIRQFVKNLNIAFDANIRGLSERIKAANEEMADDLAIEQVTEMEIVDLGQQLSIVALYRYVEMTTKKLSRHRFKDRVDGFFAIKQMKKAFQEIPFDVEALPEWPSIDELRCICNSVKHENGYAGNDLAQFSGWKRGDKLNGLDTVFERLVLSIPPYLTQVAQAVIP